MTESWWFNLLVTLLIIAASGFFVIIEFSLMGARRNRLEEDAENSRTARAGLRSLNEPVSYTHLTLPTICSV